MTENQSGCLVLFHITLGPPMKKSAAIKFWLWHSFRELLGVSVGAVIVAFVVMLAARS